MEKSLILIEQFYTAFQNKKAREMQAYYHPEATFTDPVFGLLNADEVKAMWEMLLSRAPSLQMDYKIISYTEKEVAVDWTARYVFSATQRNVINHVHSFIELKDGLIFRQIDNFNFHGWAKQSLGMVGMLLGSSNYLQNKTKNKARQSLQAFMHSQAKLNAQ